MTMGRPTDFTLAMFEAICDRHANGEWLSSICRTEGYPNRMTFHAWKRKDEALAAMWADATVMFEETQLDAVLDISDDSRNDYISQMADNGDVDAANAKLNGEHIQRSKLRVDSRFKLLAIRNPKKYGTNSVNLNHGGQADNPIGLLLTQINGSSVKPVADDDD